VGGSDSDGMPQRTVAVERSARSSGAPSESRALAEAAAGKRLPVTMSCHPLTLEVVSLPVDRAPAEMPICTVTQLPACRTCIGNTRLLPCIRRHGPGVLSRLRGPGSSSIRCQCTGPRALEWRTRLMRLWVEGGGKEVGWVGVCLEPEGGCP
jgi:hypothetical protein